MMNDERIAIGDDSHSPRPAFFLDSNAVWFCDRRPAKCDLQIANSDFDKPYFAGFPQQTVLWDDPYICEQNHLMSWTHR